MLNRTVMRLLYTIVVLLQTFVVLPRTAVWLRSPLRGSPWLLWIVVEPLRTVVRPPEQMRWLLRITVMLLRTDMGLTQTIMELLRTVI